jgi:hypothetical protein
MNPKHEKTTAMPTLKITKIKCHKKRDPIGKDEIDTYVLVDDSNTETFLWGPSGIPSF